MIFKKHFDGNPFLEVGVFPDISKAFDKVWHIGLLFKLKHMRINGPLYQLLKNYLNNRKKTCCFERCILIRNSDWADMKAGEPHGSVLGLLLFLIYITDLPDALKCNTHLFADDTSIFSIVNNTNGSCHNLNADLLKINNWAHQWKMCFNPDPNKQVTEIKFFHKFNHDIYPPIYFNNAPVVSQLSIKHLGMILDSKLNFDYHISEKISKANKGIGLIKRLRVNISRKHLITIYKSFIQPHLDYGDIIYDKLNSDTFINMIVCPI